MQKISFWGSVASIIGFIAMIFSPVHAESGNHQESQIIIPGGTQNPTIGVNKGNVNINYNNAPAVVVKSHVLRNAKGGAVLVIDVPDFSALSDQTKQVCTAINGTPITLLSETKKYGLIDKWWQKIEINDGACANKTGWVSVENISYE